MQNLTDQEMTLLEDYWNQRLPDPEKNKLEHRLRQDDVFRTASEEMYTIFNAMHALRIEDWRTRIDQTMQDMPEYLPEASKNRTRKSIFWLIAVLCLLTIIFFVGYEKFTTRLNPTQLAAREALQLPKWRGTNMSDLNQVKGLAAQAYQSRDYQAAIKYLETYTAADHADIQALFYLGLAYLGDQQIDKALHVFEQLKGQQGMDAEELKWFTALALLQDNQQEQGKQYLQEIATQGVSYRDDASNLLRELQRQE